MAHIHFAWELGAGLGHAGRLKPLVQEALKRGHKVTMALRDLIHTDNLLKDVGVPRFQSPFWLHKVHGVPSPAASLAEILLGCGYLNANALNGLFIGWRNLLDVLKPDLVVADYSPTAVLAARSLGITSVTIGIGFFLPPDVAPMPLLRDWEPIHPGRLAASDAQMLEAINTVLVQSGGKPLARAAQALQGDIPLLLTWPELDHYGRTELPSGHRWWGPSMLSQAGLNPSWPKGAGPKAFAYLKSEHPDHELVLKALVLLGCRTVCYLPEVAAGRPPPVVSPLIDYARGPVDLEATLPGCELCVCHSGEATLAQALLAGIPAFLLPTQTEQFLIARQAEKTGSAINAASRPRPLDYAGAMGTMLGNSSYRKAAESFAGKYGGFTPQQHTLDLVDEFERHLK